MKKELYGALGAIFFGMIYFNITQTCDAANYSYTLPDSAIQNQSSLQGNVTYVPAGTTASVMLTTALSSESSTEGSIVNAVLTQDFIYNNQTIASKGSSVTGTVIKAKKAGIGNRNGQLQIVFNNITTTQGTNIPINAVIKTDDNKGILKGAAATDSAKDYAKNTVIGAGAGAALGTAMGALSSGSVGKGAIYGTALGGGIGLAKGALTKGDNISIPQNACLDIYFTQPVTVSTPVKEYNGYYNYY